MIVAVKRLLSRLHDGASHRPPGGLHDNYRSKVSDADRLQVYAFNMSLIHRASDKSTPSRSISSFAVACRGTQRGGMHSR